MILIISSQKKNSKKYCRCVLYWKCTCRRPLNVTCIYLNDKYRAYHFVCSSSGGRHRLDNDLSAVWTYDHLEAQNALTPRGFVRWTFENNTAARKYRIPWKRSSIFFSIPALFLSPSLCLSFYCHESIRGIIFIPYNDISITDSQMHRSIKMTFG